jgi:hypothetical protein
MCTGFCVFKIPILLRLPASKIIYQPVCNSKRTVHVWLFCYSVITFIFQFFSKTETLKILFHLVLYILYYYRYVNFG